jgi:hypothetical protein
VTSDLKWLLLLYSLPTKRSAERVTLWRQLKKSGALSLKTSAYLLPDVPEHYERLQWLAQQVRDGGGEATLIRVTDIESLPRAEIVRLFNEARAADYAELNSELNELLLRNKKRRDESLPRELEKLRARFEKIRKIDFFECSKAHDVQMLLHRAETLRAGRSKTAPQLTTRRFQGKTWLTRPRPEIDRVGSAWLIRKFIDPKARFIFANDAAQHPEALPYDMVEVEFSHHGDDCTFETLVKRFAIADKAVRKIAEMVHEADLEDGKYQHAEAIGIDRVLKGWAALGVSDEELLRKGADCFNALYRYLRK